MNTSRISQQFSDLLIYVLLPGLAIIMPASLSLRLVRVVSRWRWFLFAAADAAYQGASEFVDSVDEVLWKQRWKQVEVLDVRDLYMMLCGRSRTVLAEIECSQSVEVATDRVMIGMHWGPSSTILKYLAQAGLNPAIPYRPTEKHILRVRPFYYLFSRMASRYLIKTMAERAVPVGGAGKTLRAMLDKPGSVFVVMDAPPMEGRSTMTTEVLGAKANFNAGFPAILADKGKEYVFYAMNLHPDNSTRKWLELEGPFRSESAEEFLQKYAQFLDRHLRSDSTHWRIWHVARQFWAEGK